MKDDFLLPTPLARTLYFDYARNLPILDYHTHIDAAELAENSSYMSLGEVWLAHDHYKWRLMRAGGVPEHLITGDASYKEKCRAFLGVLRRAPANPLYHFCEMELATFFDWHTPIYETDFDRLWAHTEVRCASGTLTPRTILKTRDVRYLATTNDPCETLVSHQNLASDKFFSTIVCPTFRPDKAFALRSADFPAYVQTLERAADMSIIDFPSLCAALAARMNAFSKCGCRISDHGFSKFVYRKSDSETLDRTVRAALSGASVSEEDAAAVETALLLFCASEYKRRGWVMQLHLDCLRNPNSLMFARLGADAGFDGILPSTDLSSLAALFDRLTGEDILPRTLVYSLGMESTTLANLLGTFQSETARLGLGTAWWFHDHWHGIQTNLRALATQGLLGNFVGMLTDARSLLGMVRHDYFRRVTAAEFARLAESDILPRDTTYLGELLSALSWQNARTYFGLEEILPWA